MAVASAVKGMERSLKRGREVRVRVEHNHGDHARKANNLKAEREHASGAQRGPASGVAGPCGASPQLSKPDRG